MPWRSCWRNVPDEKMPLSEPSPVKPEVLVGVITFRRPVMLARLLDSLAHQTLAAEGVMPLALVLVDNDPQRSAEPVFADKVAALPFPATYLCETRRGIPFARNRVLEFAIAQGARYLAFVDDDEVVPADWLAELHSVITANDADAVQGPVEYLAEPGSPPWMVEDLARRSAKMVRRAEASPKAKLSTRNLIMSVRLADELGLRFDDSFALSGGSDIDFFYRAHLAGAKNLWTNRGRVRETIPRARLELGFQLQRAFRSAAGTTHSRRRIHGVGRTLLRTLPKIVDRLVRGLLLLVTTGLFSRRRRVVALRTLASGVGHVAGLLGITGEQYRRIQGY